jgi:flagellar biosynthesis/type III secretory pathway protein FliH
VGKDPGTEVRPFSWNDLEDGAAGREGQGSRSLRGPSAGGEDPKGPEASTPVRPYRWGELEGTGNHLGPGTGRAGGGVTDPGRAPNPAELARREAEAILATARQQAQRLLEAARAEGLAAGQAEGRRALSEAAENLVSVARELAEHKPALYEEARAQVVELALAVVGRLLGPLAEGDEGAVVRVVERALLVLSDRETMTLRVHPEDLRSLLDAKPHLLETFDGIQKLTVLEDHAVRRGGCLVQTPASEIDARLETQLAELARTLRIV